MTTKNMNFICFYVCFVHSSVVNIHLVPDNHCTFHIKSVYRNETADRYVTVISFIYFLVPFQDKASQEGRHYYLRITDVCVFIVLGQNIMVILVINQGKN